MYAQLRRVILKKEPDMKPLSNLFLMIMFSFSVVIAANMPDPTSELQNEITVDETIKTFIKDLCENLTLDDYIHHESGVEALMRCCQRLEHNANSLPLQDLILAYPLLLARYQVLVNELPNDDTLKTPRENLGRLLLGLELVTFIYQKFIERNTDEFESVLPAD